MKMFIVGLLFTSACATSVDGPSEELRALGITKLSVVEAERRLVVEAHDSQGTVIASLQLDEGRFVMEDDDRGEVEGRRMSVTVGAQTAQHESEGYAALQLPYPHLREIGVFFADPTVAASLKRWGISVNTTAPPALEPPEAPYFYECQNGTSNVETILYGASNVQQSTYTGCSTSYKYKFDRWVAGQKGEWRCCSTTNVLADRQCAAPNTSTYCGTTGSGCCALCWTIALPAADNYCKLTPVYGEDWVLRADHCQ